MGWVCKPWMKMMMMQVSNLVSVPPGGGCTGLLVVVDGVAGEAVEGLSSDRTPYCCCCYWAPPKRGAGTHPNSRLVERCPGWPQGGGNNRSFNNSSYHIMFMFIYREGQSYRHNGGCVLGSLVRLEEYLIRVCVFMCMGTANARYIIS